MGARHTPGPWATEIANYGSPRIGTVFAGAVDIARIVVVGDGLNARTDANALLIAAAPDLELCLAETAGMLAACIDIAGGKRPSRDAVQHLRDQHAKCIALLAKAGAAQ